MSWLKRTFDSKKQEVRGKKMEAPAFSSYFLHLTSYSKFRLFTPVLLALFTSFLIRLRRIPRIFALYLFTAKIRGAVRYFLKRRNIEQSDSAARQRMTPMSMAKLSWVLLIKKSRKILPYLASRGNPGTTGSMIHTAAVLSSPQDFITGGGGSSLLS